MTLYIEGHEITAPAGGGTLTAVRSYGFGDQPVATRTPTGLDYLVSDNQGSLEQTIPAGSSTAEHTRTYFPYGKLRTGGQPDTDHSWIGQIEDDATSLSFLNARYYDPATAVFTAPDPLYDPSNPRSLNPYAYSWNSPVTVSDGSGLSGCIGDHPCQSGSSGRSVPIVAPDPVQQIQQETGLEIPDDAEYVTFDIPRWDGYGITRFQYFIDDDDVCLAGNSPVDFSFQCGHGDDRGFASGADMVDYNLGARVRVILDHERGVGIFISYATHTQSGDSKASLPIKMDIDPGRCLPDNYPNHLMVYTHGEGLDGNIAFRYRLLNSQTPATGAWLAPPIDGLVRVRKADNGTVRIDGLLDQYPSVEIMRDKSQSMHLIYQRAQESGGPANLFEPQTPFETAG